MNALLPDASGLWVGVGGSGLFRRDLQRPHFRNFRHDPQIERSLSGDYITALAAGRAGQVWVGTRSNGLNLCQVEPWSCERFDGRAAGERNIGHYHVTSLHRDRAGALWVATGGAGIHRVNEDVQGRVVSIEHWDVSRGLLNDAIMAVESDDDGSLWLSTRYGLSRLDPATGRVVNHVSESGLPVSHFNTGASSTDSAWLYFGSVDGLLSIPRGTPMRPRRPTPVQVTAIETLTRGTAMPMPPSQLSGGIRNEIRRRADARIRSARFRRDHARLCVPSERERLVDRDRPATPIDLFWPGRRPVSIRSARPRCLRALEHEPGHRLRGGAAVLENHVVPGAGVRNHRVAGVRSASHAIALPATPQRRAGTTAAAARTRAGTGGAQSTRARRGLRGTSGNSPGVSSRQKKKSAPGFRASCMTSSVRRSPPRRSTCRCSVASCPIPWSRNASRTR